MLLQFSGPYYGIRSVNVWGGAPVAQAKLIATARSATDVKFEATIDVEPLTLSARLGGCDWNAPYCYIGSTSEPAPVRWPT